MTGQFVQALGDQRGGLGDVTAALRLEGLMATGTPAS
jgi:hypothetical protein